MFTLTKSGNKLLCSNRYSKLPVHLCTVVLQLCLVLISFTGYCFFILFYFFLISVSEQLCYIVLLPFIALIHLSPLQSPRVVHVCESFFLFAQSLPPHLPPPFLPSCSLSMSLSLFCLLVQFVYWIPHE